jgi:hypothetical protein
VAEEFLAAYDPHRPGCLLLDVRLRHGSGLDLLADIPSGIRVVMLSMHDNPALVELAGSDTRLPYKVARIRNYWPRSSESHSGLRARATAAGFKTVPRGDR